jgi:hypothetical protein
MAELVDAPDSKSGFRKKVQVRFLFWALNPANAGFFHALNFSTGGHFDEFPFLW